MGRALAVMLVVVVVVVVIVVLVEPSAGLPSSHPLHSVVDRVNEERGPMLAVVVAVSPEADALTLSGEFVPFPVVPFIDLYGRRFHIGIIRNVNVVFVMSGERRLNAGITVQILLDVFNVWGIVHYGIAGSSNDSMSFGDVSIPKSVAFTGCWTWTRFNSEKEEYPSLSFGSYNIPTEGANFLSSVEFKPEELYSVGKPMEEVFWLQVDSEWFKVAEHLKDLKLQQCINATYCLPEAPKIVFGLKASTADVFVDNAAYRTFLFKKFGVSTVDEESAAVVMAGISPGIPVIVIRGVSDLAGGEASWSSSKLSDIASMNSLKVTLEFIEIIGKRKQLKAF